MSNPANTQDWETVVFTKKPTQNYRKKPADGLNTNPDRITVKKGGPVGGNTNGPTVQSSRLRKLDEAEEPEKIKTVSLSLGQTISKVRQEKGLKQKDLAVKLNVKNTVIQEYESGRAIPDARLLGKMEKVLGIKLRGHKKDQGTKL